MLAQLLGQQGLAAKAIRHADVSRDKIGTLDPAGIAMVCISYVEISGSPAHLHYLLRRLRGRLPGVPMMVGLWPADDEVMLDKRLRSVIGADHFMISLQEAVDICVDAARLPDAAAGEAAAGEARPAPVRPAPALA